MAKAGKLSADLLKRHERVDKPRLVDVRSVRLYYLIVCEGEKTEPNYFKGLIADLPQPTTELCQFYVEGKGYNTLSLVEYALEERSRREKQSARIIDRLWVVFDRDSFTAQNFNGAIKMCVDKSTNEKQIEVAWTNEAFELWYLLHFNYHDTALNRAQYKDILSEAITKKAGSKYEYKKNDPATYQLMNTYGSEKLAIRYAQKLDDELWEGRTDYANHNPCTKVYCLVEELRGLKVELEKK